MTDSKLYPLGLRIAGRKVVVIGAGVVGTRRVKGLLDAAAFITVISPTATEEVKQLAADARIVLISREYEAGDLTDAWLVHTATGIASADDAVTREAESLRILCVNAAEAEKSTAWVPAVLRLQDATVAAFGNGEPRRAKAIRNQIASWLQAEPFVQTPGTVALVGGGPGDVDLITVAGKKLLAGADVVVFDRLSPAGLLENLGDDVELIDVGKAPDNHPVPQEQINQILVDQAKLGKRVVRLKGGDPYVFGRGGEELEFCAANGVTAFTVSGISSSIAVPALAGIPVTHRGLATSFTVVTGHEPVSNLPGGADHTIVILMGVGTLADSAANLQAEGRSADCPVAIVEEGFGANQRVTISTLGSVAKDATEVGVKAPAVVIIGDVVKLAPAASAAQKSVKESNE
ncbi:uroporphyrinogen-III C-methyltransferase [Rhodoluna sp.]|uniref:uroporphyrinogen-III C-methyltransferase n=1 Tax=Rhodoluna sp. TaxID=1969481 RepID=UPI0025E32C64|nr:uroporphyrinogen-III C-methyltransferase [Rhodoluna sp.]